jgi:hypothetical protein
VSNRQPTRREPYSSPLQPREPIDVELSLTGYKKSHERSSALTWSSMLVCLGLGCRGQGLSKCVRRDWVQESHLAVEYIPPWNSCILYLYACDSIVVPIFSALARTHHFTNTVIYTLCLFLIRTNRHYAPLHLQPMHGPVCNM